MKKIRIFASALCIISLLISCRSLREHRTNKYINKVLADPNATQKVYEFALSLHPINNLPEIVTKDSIVYYVPNIITPIIPQTIKANYPDINLDSLINLIPRDTIKVTQSHYITITKNGDSILQRKLGLTLDKLNTTNGENTQLKSQVVSLNKSIAKHWLWDIIGGIVSLLIIIFLSIILLKK